MAVRLKDVARLAGVSEATVSLALHDRPGVNAGTRQRILKLARELHYTPNAMAQGLVRQRSGSLGLIVPDIENPFFARLVRCVGIEARAAGYGLLLGISEDESARERRVMEDFISAQVEGVLLAPVSQPRPDLSALEQLARQGIPCVQVTSYYPGANLPRVMTDLAAGMEALAGYLLDIGHRRLVLLGGPADVPATALRLQGFRRAHTLRGLPAESGRFIPCPKPGYDDARQAALRLLGHGTDTDAILALNDAMAVAVLNVLKDGGVRVPEDVSLAGFDDMIFSTIAGVPLTTVRQDIPALAEAATARLLEQLDTGAPAPADIILPASLVVRASTRPRLPHHESQPGKEV